MFDEINEIVAILEQGGVILYPTDTIWGLGCDATNAEAVAKIYKIKHRSASKSMIVLLPDAKSVFQFVANPHPDIVDIIKSYTDPTTIIYENALNLAHNLIANDGSIGIRVTDDPFCKTLLKRFKKPIVSTSANISGQHNPRFFNEIDEAVKQAVDYVVKYRQEDETIKSPSQILKILDDGSYLKIR